MTISINSARSAACTLAGTLDTLLGYVVAHRLGAKGRLLRYLAIGVASGYQVQDLALPASQYIERLFGHVRGRVRKEVEPLVYNAPAENHPTLGHYLDRPQQVLLAGILEQIASCPDPDRGELERVVGELRPLRDPNDPSEEEFTANG